MLKEGLRNYQFDIISDIVFEHIPFDENTRELENKFNYSMRDCVIEVKIDNEKRLYDLMAYLRFVENMEKINNVK